MSDNINVVFCRTMLKITHQEVRKHFPDRFPNIVQAIWVYPSGNGRWEGQMPGNKKLYWYGQADNAYDARVKTWNLFMATEGIESKRKREAK